MVAKIIQESVLESSLINLVSSKTQVVNTHNQLINSTIAKKLAQEFAVASGLTRFMSLKTYKSRLNAAATARITARIYSEVIASINN